MLGEIVLFVVLLYFLPLFIPKDYWFRFYICYIMYIFIGTCLPFFLIPLQLISFKLYSRAIFLLMYYGTHMMGITWKIQNEHNYKKYKSGILTVNHQSIFDVCGITMVNGGVESLSGVAKKELYYIPPVAIFMRTIGIIFIDRHKSQESLDRMNNLAKRKESKITIFPEGTRNQRGGGLLPFKRGAFKLAIDNKLPIIPLVISPYTFIKKGKHFGKGKVIISCLEPIETDEMEEKDVEIIMEKTRLLMENEYFKLEKELNLVNR